MKQSNKRGGEGFKSYLLTGDKEADRKTRKKLLIDLGVTASAIARDMGVSPQLVLNTTSGNENNRRVLAHLEALARELR